MPIGVAGAVALAGTAVSAGVGIYAANQQAGAIEDAQDSANAAQREAREQARADLEPWRLQGVNALLRAANIAGANGPEAATAAMADFQTSPGYDWRRQQGLRAVDQSAAARGMLRTGATLRATQEYGDGLASQEFGSYVNRLMGLSQQGQSAAAGQAGASMTAGTNIAQTEASAGTALAGIAGQQGANLNSLFQGLYGVGKANGWFNSGAGSPSIYATNNANSGSMNALMGPGF